MLAALEIASGRVIAHVKQRRTSVDLQAENLRQRKRTDELHLENLRLQLELQRYKKWRYGPRADRLTNEDMAQALLDFGEELQRKPIHPEDVPGRAEPEYELRRVKRRSGRRHLANFEKASGHNPGLRTQPDGTPSGVTGHVA
jgi:hypothetical protein